MAHRPAIQVVCFDIGGVLARIVGHWSEACQRAGVPVRDEFVLPDQQQQLVRCTRRFETGKLDVAGFSDAICDCSAYRPNEVVAILEHWIVDLFPGTDELLTTLAERGVPTALLSNTNELHWQQMMATEPCFAPLKQVQRRFASHLIRARKPDAGAYEHVERELGVPSEGILFFDDLEENVNGAIWAHWQAERIDPADDPARQITQHLKRYGVL